MNIPEDKKKWLYIGAAVIGVIVVLDGISGMQDGSQPGGAQSFIDNSGVPVNPANLRKVVLDTPHIEAQKTAVWCWAASIQNVLASYNVRVSQEQIVTATYGTTKVLPLFDPRDAAKNLLMANSLVAAQGMVIHPFYSDGVFPAAALVHELEKEKSPLLVFYKHQSGGHVVVCYGVEYEPTDQGPRVTKVLVKDPWGAQLTEWRGRDLASMWAATIMVRVAPRPKQQWSHQGTPYGVSQYFDVINLQTQQVEARLWYLREKRAWHVFSADGQDFGPIP